MEERIAPVFSLGCSEVPESRSLLRATEKLQSRRGGGEVGPYFDLKQRPQHGLVDEVEGLCGAGAPQEVSEGLLGLAASTDDRKIARVGCRAGDGPDLSLCFDQFRFFIHSELLHQSSAARRQ